MLRSLEDGAVILLLVPSDSFARVESLNSDVLQVQPRRVAYYAAGFRGC